MTSTVFCCSQMELATNDATVPLVFTPKFREFGILILDGGTSVLAIAFCPWCAQKLPESLRDAWFDELERRGIDPYGSDMPEEFMDERWYTKPERA